MWISKTPFRVSLFGGGSDYPIHFKKHGGACLNLAINKYCYITYRTLTQSFGPNFRVRYSNSESSESIEGISHPAVKALLTHYKIENPTEINHSSDLPAKTGIGSSSSFVVGLTSILQSIKNEKLSKFELAKKAIHIEQHVIKESVGLQDSIISTYGGINLIEIKQDGAFKVNEVTASKDYLEFITSNLLLVKVGQQRVASNIVPEQLKNMSEKHSDLNLLSEMARTYASKFNDESLDLNDLGRALNDAWRIKVNQSNAISNEEINNFYSIAMKNGALGGKLCGAGSGGFFLLVVPTNTQSAFRSKFPDSLIVNFKVDFEGNKIDQIF